MDQLLIPLHATCRVKKYNKGRYSTAVMRVLLLLLLAQDASSQTCTGADDLLKIQGKFTDHSATPAGGYVSFYTAAEKSSAAKTMTALETIFKKSFVLHGGTGKGFFGFKQGNYFGKNFLFSYSFNTGFYHFICAGGAIQPAHEYGTSLEITANPYINPFFSLPAEFASNESMFYTVTSRKIGYRMIPVFSYLIFENPDEVEKINSESGYTDSREQLHDAYDKHPDIYRNWYITKPGSKILVEVSRREYLESLLEYYECEKKAVSIKNENLLKESMTYMAVYEKNGNKAMYQSHLENKQKAESALAASSRRYEEKKAAVTALLRSGTANWLQQPAVIDPAIRNNALCSSSQDYKRSGYFTFAGFYEGKNGSTVYQWNPELFRRSSAATPVFFKVSIRYKKDLPFSTDIKDHYSTHLDFSSIGKLL